MPVDSIVDPTGIFFNFTSMSCFADQIHPSKECIDGNYCSIKVFIMKRLLFQSA